MRLPLLLVFATLLVSCATSSIMGAVEPGMTRDEVIAVMGEPASVSAEGDTERLNYKISETSNDAYYGFTTPYYVRLVNGRVVSYGKTGEPDSQVTTAPAETDEVQQEDEMPQEYEVRQEEEVRQEDVRQDDEGLDFFTEMRKLKQLHDEGILSDAEYAELKKKAISKY